MRCFGIFRCFVDEFLAIKTWIKVNIPNMVLKLLICISEYSFGVHFKTTVLRDKSCDLLVQMPWLFFEELSNERRSRALCEHLLQFLSLGITNVISKFHWPIYIFSFCLALAFWDVSSPLTYIEGDMKYSEGVITVPYTGKYFVYCQLFYRLPHSIDARHQ